METRALVSDDRKCDLCNNSLFTGKWFYDASVPTLNGTWAWCCELCGNINGVKLGTGLGQKYDSQTKVKILEATR